MKICSTCQTRYDDGVDYCPNDGMRLRPDRKSGPDPMIGRVLDGRWIVEEKLGEGGMGAVYRGRQRSVDRVVAIKTLRTSLNDSDEFVDRFYREARVATTFNHPHSVTIYEFGQDEDGTLYIAMEYLEGHPLSSRIDAGDLRLDEILEIGYQVASALMAAHDAQIVHRDLKPDNVFMLDIPGGGTFVKVLDFGIAKQLGSATQMTQTGQIFGTPQYMSPEQCQGHAIDGRSDLYSLGCILYELIGGRPPFHAETPMAVLMAHVFNQAEPLAVHSNGIVPVQVEEIVFRLLAKQPDDRYATAAEAREALAGALENLKADDRSSRPLAVLRAEAEPPAARLKGDAALIHAAPTLDIASTPLQLPGTEAHRRMNETASIALADTALASPLPADDAPRDDAPAKAGGEFDDLDDLDGFTPGTTKRTLVVLAAALAIALAAGAAFVLSGDSSPDDSPAADVTAPVQAAGGEAPPEAVANSAAEVVHDEPARDEVAPDEVAQDEVAQDAPVADEPVEGEPEPAVAASAPATTPKTTKTTTRAKSTTTARPAASTARSGTAKKALREETKASAPAPRKAERDPFDFFNE